METTVDLTRRAWLKRSSLALFGAGAMPGWVARAASGDASPRGTLVVIFLRGAADGLNIVVPHGEPHYYESRPNIAIRKTDLIDLDGHFGFHPMLASLKPAYDAGELAVVHAAGSPDPTRSHFDAQDYMESGTPGVKSTQAGWLNRAMPREATVSPLRAVSLTPSLARTLQGPQNALALDSIDQFQVRDRAAAAQFQQMYSSAASARIQSTARESFEAIRLLQSLSAAKDQAQRDRYPKGRLGQSLYDIARLIQSDVGLEVAFTDIGGWDHHVFEVGPTVDKGALAARVKELGEGLAAFRAHLGRRMDNVTVVTLSEFGRTVKENGTRGTDHGHANVMFVMGGSVQGGRVAGKWPGLDAHALYEERDLAVTTDFRQVLSDVIAYRLRSANAGSVFPGFHPATGSAAGLGLFGQASRVG